MSNQQNDQYNEYKYEMEKAHDERENNISMEMAQREKNRDEPFKNKDLEECNPDYNDIDENFGDNKPEIEGEEE